MIKPLTSDCIGIRSYIYKRMRTKLIWSAPKIHTMEQAFSWCLSIPWAEVNVSGKKFYSARRRWFLGSIERIDQESRLDVMFVKIPTDILCIPEYCNSKSAEAASHLNFSSLVHHNSYWPMAQRVIESRDAYIHFVSQVLGSWTKEKILRRLETKPKTTYRCSYSRIC